MILMSPLYAPNGVGKGSGCSIPYYQQTGPQARYSHSSAPLLPIRTGPPGVGGGCSVIFGLAHFTVSSFSDVARVGNGGLRYLALSFPVFLFSTIFSFSAYLSTMKVDTIHSILDFPLEIVEDLLFYSIVARLAYIETSSRMVPANLGVPRALRLRLVCSRHS